MKTNLMTLQSCLKECIAADIPAFIWGSPGVGKSESVHQVGAALHYLPGTNVIDFTATKSARPFKVIDFRATLRDQVDLRGVPVPNLETRTTMWLAPDELPQINRDGDCGILFMDELNCAHPSVQAACFGLVLERRLGEYKLPPGWLPIAAGNRTSDRAAAQKMPSALANRFAHFEVEPDVKTWIEAYALTRNLPAVMIAWARSRPDLMHRDPKSAEERAYPTFRQWTKVARIVDRPSSIRMPLVAALVGEAEAMEFEGFCRIFTQLTPIDEIIAHPERAKVPHEPALLFAVSAALARFATRDNFASIMTYARRLPNEYQVLTAHDSVRRHPTLKDTGAYTRFLNDNTDIMN
jgi:MoxR-like ATPase